jgi:class 3 adenylate cyclase
LSLELISIAARIFERLAPFYVLWDLQDEVELISVPLRKYWHIPEEVNQGVVFLTRPYRGELQPDAFEQLTGIMLTAHWEKQGENAIRGELIPLGDRRWILVGFPPIASFSELQSKGFLLSDLPLNSGVGDSIIAIESAQISLKQAQQALEELESSNTVLSNLNQVFSRFVPTAFLDQLGLHSPLEAELGTHRSVEVSVMFADLRGFTSLSEKMSSQQIFAFLNRFLAFVAPNIRNNGGFVVHYVGDGVLALFAGPPDQAVRAAVEMQRGLADAVAVGGLGDFLQEAGRVRLGIGLTFGAVEMGIIGESGRWDPAVISDSVNVAARLQELTKSLGSQILVTGELQKSVAANQGFHFRRLGRLALAGKRERIEVWEVLDGLPLAERTRRILNRKVLETALEDLETGRLEKGRAGLAQYLQSCPDDPVAQHFLG